MEHNESVKQKSKSFCEKMTRTEQNSLLDPSGNVFFCMRCQCVIGAICDPNFAGLVLGCIEADVRNQNTRWKALDKIYQMYILLHLCNRNISAAFHLFFATFAHVLHDFRRDICRF